jgi:alpha-beta hydrolase superfamily lysophospholipase
MPLGWMRTFLAWEPAVEPEDFAVCPVVLAHPAADRWTPIELSLRFLHRIPAEHRSVVLLEGAGHVPVERPGLDQLAGVVLERLRAAATAHPTAAATAHPTGDPTSGSGRATNDGPGEFPTG